MTSPESWVHAQKAAEDEKIDAFFELLAKYKSEFIWKFNAAGGVRARGFATLDYCPLTAVCEKHTGRWEPVTAYFAAGTALGLPVDFCDEVVRAADTPRPYFPDANEYYKRTRAMRQRLLSAVGLTEVPL